VSVVMLDIYNYNNITKRILNEHESKYTRSCIRPGGGF
jgi:hypothetical protein